MYNESKHTQVRGHAVAESGGAGTQSVVQWIPEFSNISFETVPNRKKLILTDVIFNPQGDVTAPHWINISEKRPNGSTEIIIQFNVPPNATQQIHFHTGSTF